MATVGTNYNAIDTKNEPKIAKADAIYDSLNRLDGIVKEFEMLVCNMKSQTETAERPQEKHVAFSVESVMKDTPTVIDVKIKRLSECLSAIKEMLF